ncbi:hemerythrin family protein [Candidatus Sumerlaeota bacterium]|nr:hemerythrin family protein [Candidatus Sumerlaeota bacterium]
MSLIEWQDDYSVGIRNLDDQHKVLIDLINLFHDARSHGKEWQTLSIVLRSLMEYAATHFAGEEKLMIEHDFPGLHQHRLAHNEFVQKVSDFSEDFRESRAMLPQELMNFLGEWLVGHILVVDKQYSGFFKERGYG